jgi:hypothetical protein
VVAPVCLVRPANTITRALAYAWIALQTVTNTAKGGVFAPLALLIPRQCQVQSTALVTQECSGTKLDVITVLKAPLVLEVLFTASLAHQDPSLTKFEPPALVPLENLGIGTLMG